MLDRSSHAFSERLFGYEGAAWGPRYTTENFLQRLRGNAASAIAAPAKIWFVRIADIDVHCSEGPLCSLSFESERYGPQAYHVDDRAF
jgi:hypothetical protein